MNVYGEELREVVTDVICDICGKSCKTTMDFEFGILHSDWGFDSKKDGEHHLCQMCEDCYNEVVDFILSRGGKIKIENYL
jgi:hypothetical protein